MNSDKTYAHLIGGSAALMILAIDVGFNRVRSVFNDLAAL